jgi:acetolactate synthase I/II/III large subunit
MNGAESLVRTLIASGVEVCFANPGTSEIHFVAALDKVSGMRAILCLFEGVVTGAADGYGRMTEKPACTLLHLGPGLANGLANLHNGRRAETPIVNIIGDHATYHSQYDAPLASDVAGFAQPVSGWIRTSRSALTVAADAARAVQASREPPVKLRLSFCQPIRPGQKPIDRRQRFLCPRLLRRRQKRWIKWLVHCGQARRR